MPPLHSPRVDWVMEGRILSLLAQPAMKYRDIIEEIYRQTKKVISKSKITKARRRMEEGRVNSSPKKRGFTVMTNDKLIKLGEMAAKSNPPLHQKMAKELNISNQLVIINHIDTWNEGEEERRKCKD